MQETGPSHIVQALPTGSRKGRKTLSKRDAASPQTPSSSRCTRSQAAPDWTVQEILILVSEIAAVDEDWLKALSSYQRWKIISDNCMALDVNRSSNQCKRKWESLLSDYRKISDWELQSGADSYWCLDSERRKKYNLPALFDQEVFGSMDAVIKAQETQSGSGDSDSEDLIGATEVEMLGVDGDSDFSGPEEEARSKTWKDTGKAQVMADKLQESAQQVHAILRGELTDNASRGHALVDLTKPNAIETVFTRRQADELIKTFGDLVSTLNHFTELIKNGGCEEIRPADSLVL